MIRKQSNVAVGAFGSTPDAKGASLSGRTITVQPADATHPGAVALGAQTLGSGTKTVDALVSSGTITATGAVLPSASETYALGSSTKLWDAYLRFMKDNADNTRFQMNVTPAAGGSGSNNFISFSANTGSAVAMDFHNAAALGDGDKLVRWRTNFSEKLALAPTGKFIYPAAGAADVRGTATLVGGTVTVSTTSVKTGDKIFVSRNTPGGTVGDLSAPVASIVNSTSFVINSASGTDTSTVNWWIIA